ncbi:MAG: flagellin FliC [Acidobacteria bacterium]|nr:flagellin FliC [Acidobacteriota bacterium]
MRMNTEFQSRTIQRLTSGYRINASGDDAAGLAVANCYRSIVAELNQGIRNVNDGLSQLQIVDGGRNNISKMVDRLRTLATQAASDTFPGDLSTLNEEFNAIKTKIDRQAANIGLTPEAPNARSLEVFAGDTSVVDSTGLGIHGDNLTDKAAAKTALSPLTTATSKLRTIQGQAGSSQNKLQYAINLASSQATNIAAADTRIRDADLAAEASNLTKAQVLQQSSMAALAQANSVPQPVLTLLRQ